MNGRHHLEPAVEAVGLRRTYGGVHAVDGLDLTIPRGGVFGLLGPNGAGKTTTIRMLAGLTAIDGGRASVLGHDAATEGRAVRRRIALTGQYASLDEDLTAHENLTLIGRLLGHGRRGAARRADALLAAFDLSDAAAKQVKHHSGGMRRRLDIAASIVSTPDLLFLDEPTTGLDPRSRTAVWDVVRALVAAGTTVLLTTQYLEEADQLADRIAVIDHGRVIAEGTSAELKASVGRGALHVRLADPADRPHAARLLRHVLGLEVDEPSDPAALSARVEEAGPAGEALSALAAAGIAVRDLSLGRPSLDEVFLALTGRPAEEERAATDAERELEAVL